MSTREDRSSASRHRSRHLAGVTSIGAAAAYILLARPRLLKWGATDQESQEPLLGDNVITNADLTATRAITIRASADQVWPWIVQLGQGRGAGPRGSSVGTSPQRSRSRAT